MNRHRPTALLACVLVAIAVVLACSGTPASAAQTGGATFVPPPPPPKKAKLVNGRVIAPASAPKRVKQVIAAANQEAVRSLGRSMTCSVSACMRVSVPGHCAREKPSHAIRRCGCGSNSIRLLRSKTMTARSAEV